MSDAMKISLEAQIREAASQLGYFRERTLALSQHILDRDNTIVEQTRAWNDREIELLARIAGLEDELRQARQRPVVIEEVTDAE